MSGHSAIGWTVLRQCALTAATLLVLGQGLLVGQVIEWHITKDVAANKIVTTAVRKCRYLHLSGFVERRASGETEDSSCPFFGAS